MQLNSFSRWRSGIVAAAGPGPTGPPGKPLTLSRPGAPPPQPPRQPPANGQRPVTNGNGNGARPPAMAPAKPITMTPPAQPAPAQPARMDAPRPSMMPAGAPSPPGQLPRPGPPGQPPPRPPPPTGPPGGMQQGMQQSGLAPPRPGMPPPSIPVQRPAAATPPPPPGMQATLSRPPPPGPPPGPPRPVGPGGPAGPAGLAGPAGPAGPAAAAVTRPAPPGTAMPNRPPPPGAPAGPSAPAPAPPTAPGPAAAAPSRPPASPPVANPFASIMARQAAAAPPPPPPPSLIATPPARPAQPPAPTLQSPPTLQRPAPPAAPTGPAAYPPGPPTLQRPTRPAMSAPGTLAPPPQLPRPMAPSPPGLQRGPPGPLGPPGLQRGPGAPQQQVAMQKPPSRPDLLAPQPPSAAPTTQAGAVPSDTLMRPEPPSLRVLEPLMGGAGGRRIQVQEVVEEDDEPMFDEDDAEFMTAKAKGPGKRGKRKEKVTAEMKREARRLREASRAEKEAARGKRDKEEIFEVGDEGMTLDALAELLQVDESDIVRSLFMRGITLSVSQMLDKNTVKLVAADYDVVVVDSGPVDVTEGAKKRTEFISEEDVDELAPRPPVVTVMGHVDHGKTSLLDYIRKARVAAGEAGGITQAIGAYNTEVEVEGETKTICFLDTPGHEAFSAMRARGTQVTDIAIIIVAADDGVRPQTREAVAHAQAAGVPIVVAINKVDKPGADVERVKQELLELNLVPEEWGGSTTMVPVSAKKGTGVSDLLTQLLWTAEEKQLMSNPAKPARGTVIEAYLDKKRGAVATLLVQAGTLRPGDIVRAGASYGKVRALSNDLGRSMPSAGPSIAAQITGLNCVPAAGEEFEVTHSEQAARLAAAEFEEKLKMRRMLEMSGGGSMVTLASLATVDEDQEALQKLNLIIKADTSGMVEAIKGALSQLPQQSVALRFLLSGAGEISVSDIDLAAASGGLVLAFNLEADESVSSHAKRLGVNVKSYRIIYELIDDVKAAMEGKLKIVEERVPQGTAVVKALFGTGKKRVAGVAVMEGKLIKSGYITVKRGSGKAATVVYDGKLSSLRRVKDIVEEVSSGLECGVGVDGFTAWAEGDSVECYTLVSKSRRLEEARATTAVDVATLQ